MSGMIIVDERLIWRESRYVIGSVDFLALLGSACHHQHTLMMCSTLATATGSAVSSESLLLFLPLLQCLRIYSFWIHRSDGLDPDSSQNVVIDSCVLTTGDDGVAIKSGFNNAGLKFNRPTKNVLVHNVTVNNDCCNGFCIGSETSGGIENIVFDSCTSLGSPGNAFNIKSAAGRGAYVRNVTFVNSFVGGASNGISIDEHYGGSCVEPACNSSAIPEVSGITFKNIKMVDNHTQLSRTAGKFLGISGVGSPGFIRDLKVEQVSLRARDGSAWQCQDTEGVSVHDVSPDGLTSACSGHD